MIDGFYHTYETLRVWLEHMNLTKSNTFYIQDYYVWFWEMLEPVDYQRFTCPWDYRSTRELHSLLETLI